ncbi:MAG TPA: DUF1203 domain-containing protein [Steroidobacteraceae bacterium]|jgi:hypothetical protein|nr:DUF1203 domain-containing protein [Steroidobacteraceae bacterium]
MASFQLSGIPYDSFAPLFALSDPELSRLNARRMFADARPGFPCRVSLADAEIGEELLLLPFEHQPAVSPYRSSGPIFVRKAAVRAVMEPAVVPDYVRTRLMSVRAYDATHQMIEARVVPGTEAAGVIEEMFSRREAAYIHLHNAARGCFSCAVQRID